MLNTPLVSIIIPAYNAAPYISDAIRSVQQQTYTNWELLITDDGSTDDTATAAKPFLADERIRYTRQTNSGVSAARNNGIAASRGAYIGFLDADDALLPESIAEKVKVLEADSKTDFVYGDVLYCDAALKPTGDVLVGSDDDLLNALLRWKSTPLPLSCGNVIARRKIFDAGFRFDTSLSTAADQDFSFHLAHHYAGKHLHINSTLYRVLPGSMSRNIAVMEKDHLQVYRKAAQAGMFHSSAFRRECFGRLYLTLAGSWRVNGNNTGRAIRFTLRALFTWGGAWPIAFQKLMRR
jgi:glycosyltransferase involved in cell wall biosynthesis